MVCWRSLLVVSLVAVTAFAGCTEDPPDTVSGDDDPILHRSPDDLGNVTDADRNRSHLHDYWNGRTQMMVFDDSFSTTCYCGQGAPLFRYEPPGGAIFPQGTAWVNVTVSWSDHAAALHDDATFWVETAADHEPRRIGPIASGDTITVRVTNNTQNDLPHERLSRWAFEVRVGAGVPQTGLWHYDGEISIAATAARGLDIPVFPPHPELWNGTSEIALLEQDERAVPIYYGNPETGQYGESWLGPHMPDDGIVVPYDMGHVLVEVTYSDDAVIPLVLAYHGAEDRTWNLVEPDGQDGQTYRYIITPDEGRPDGPYAKQSSWVFEFFTEADRPVFAGGYTIRATAFLDPPQ